MTLTLANAELWQTQSFIDGQWQSSDARFAVENPADLSEIAEVYEVTAAQLEQAVDSAHLAQKDWRLTTVEKRALILRRWFELIMANQADLAAIMVAEQGKPMVEALGEVAYGAKYVEWYAEQARRINGELLPVNQAGKRAMVMKRPVGVVSAITPWNFPGAMILRKAAAAIAAGCSFIVKPSELTPLSALALAQLSLDAGIPRGVFNVVVGSNSQAIGEVLTTHKKIAKFSFTGSTAVGKQLLRQCSSSVKKASMELGGNAPLIVFDDADLDVAVTGALNSKFRNSGQTCVCANRFFVHRYLLDEFVEQLEEKVARLKLGEGNQRGVDIGPLINAQAVSKVQRLIDQALQSGAHLVMGGQAPDQSGHYFTPTILTGVDASMDIFNTEIFGPVVSIIPFEDEEEVLKLANQTDYGLCAYVFTQNLNRIWRLSEQLEFGMVGINEGLLSNPAAPFGGVKESGQGREGGSWGIEEYLETRYVCIGALQ